MNLFLFIELNLLIGGASAASNNRFLQLPDGGGDDDTSTCSSSKGPTYTTPSAGSCMTLASNVVSVYPDHFSIKNSVSHYTCASSGVRVIVSNGIPDHDLTLDDPNNTPCETNWMVSVPLVPSFSGATLECASMGIIGMSLNGVPAYGARESDGANAVERADGDAAGRSWGHAAPDGNWHYHSGEFGLVTDAAFLSSTTLVGFALDGFPIYGPLTDDSVLDECNGIGDTAAEYKYHIRSLPQVNESSSYCDGTSAAIRWNYILGCFKGTMTLTEVCDSMTATLPPDCVLDTPLTLVDTTSVGVSAVTRTLADVITTPSPVAAPALISPGFPSCVVCGAGKVITIPDGVVTPPAPRDPTNCQTIQQAGLLGFIEAEFCPFIVVLLQNCGCANVTAAPTTAAPVPPMTPAPVVVVTPAPVPATTAPVMFTPAPVPATTAPVIVTPAPVTATAAPVMVTPTPIVVTPAPVMTTLAPATAAPVAVVVTPAPVLATTAPILVTPAPVPTTTAPVMVTLAPATPAPAPVVVTPAPVIVTPAPVPATTAPILVTPALVTTAAPVPFMVTPAPIPGTTAPEMVSLAPAPAAPVAVVVTPAPVIVPVTFTPLVFPTEAPSPSPSKSDRTPVPVTVAPTGFPTTVPPTAFPIEVSASPVFVVTHVPITAPHPTSAPFVVTGAPVPVAPVLAPVTPPAGGGMGMGGGGGGKTDMGSMGKMGSTKKDLLLNVFRSGNKPSTGGGLRGL